MTVGGAAIVVAYGGPVKPCQFPALFFRESHPNSTVSSLDQMRPDFRNQRVGVVLVVQIVGERLRGLDRKGMRQERFRITGVAVIHPVRAKPALRRVHLLVARGCFDVAALGVRGSDINDFARIIAKLVEDVQHPVEFPAGPENPVSAESAARDVSA